MTHAPEQALSEAQREPASHAPPRGDPVLRLLVLACVLLAMAGVAISDRDVLVGLGLPAAAIAGWLVTRAGSGLPRWFTTLLLAGVLVASAARALAGTAPVSAFSAFLAAIAAVKFWEQRRPRDEAQLLSLSVFLVIAGTLSGASIWLGVLILGYLPLGAAAIMRYQVLAAQQRQTGTVASATPGLARPIARLTVASLLSAAPVAVLVFVLVPRGVGFQEFGPIQRVRAGQRTTGFADEVDLTRQGRISTSSARVLEVALFDDRTGVPMGGTGERYYMRGAVLDAQDQGRWHKSDYARSSERSTYDRGQFGSLDNSQGQGRVIRQEVTTRAGAHNDVPLFSLLRARSIDFGDLAAPVQVVVDPRTATAFYQGGTGMMTYRIRSVVDETPMPVLLQEPVRRTPGQARGTAAADLAERILNDEGLSPDPTRRPIEEDALAARKLEAYLRLNYTYSLSPPPAPLRGDPLDYFLRVSHRGHCEFFASALATMCRSVGIDARVVAGYVASEFDEAHGVYVVRESNAHAWVEVQVAPGVWRTYDATPPSELESATARQVSITGRLVQWLELIEESWNRQIVSFDERRQAALFGQSSGTPGSIERGAGWVRRHIHGALAVLRSPGFWIGAGVTLALALGVFLWARRRRRVARGTGWALPGPAAREYRRWLRALRDRGQDKPDWMPLSTFTRRVSRSHPEAAGVLQRASDLFDQAAFAPGDPPDLGELRTLVGRLPASLVALSASERGPGRTDAQAR